MKRWTQFLVSVFITISVMWFAAAVADDEKQATLTKGKFAVPINHEVVEADWTARGYSKPKIESYPQGWSRGEHTHPVNLIMTIVTGRMEFVFGKQRLVVEPGDEIFYAAHIVHSARNLYDGTTQMMESYERSIADLPVEGPMKLELNHPPQNGQSPWPDDPAVAPGAGGSSH